MKKLSWLLHRYCFCFSRSKSYSKVTSSWAFPSRSRGGRSQVWWFKNQRAASMVSPLFSLSTQRPHPHQPRSPSPSLTPPSFSHVPVWSDQPQALVNRCRGRGKAAHWPCRPHQSWHHSSDGGSNSGGPTPGFSPGHAPWYWWGPRLEENDGKLTRGLLELPSSVSSSSRTIFTHWALIAPPPQAPQSQGLETCSEYLSSPLLAQLCPYTRLFEGWLFPSQQALWGLPSNADAGGCPPSPQAADLTIPLFHSSPSWCQATNRPFLHLRDDSGQAQDKGDAADSKSCGAEKWNGKEPMPQSLKGMDFAVRLI